LLGCWVILRTYRWCVCVMLWVCVTSVGLVVYGFGLGVCDKLGFVVYVCWLVGGLVCCLCLFIGGWVVLVGLGGGVGVLLSLL